MNTQKACEVLEGFLQRDISGKGILTLDEFNALNIILLELAIKGLYKVKEEDGNGKD